MFRVGGGGREALKTRFLSQYSQDLDTRGFCHTVHVTVTLTVFTGNFEIYIFNVYCVRLSSVLFQRDNQSFRGRV